MRTESDISGNKQLANYLSNFANDAYSKDELFDLLTILEEGLYTAFMDGLRVRLGKICTFEPHVVPGHVCRWGKQAGQFYIPGHIKLKVKVNQILKKDLRYNPSLNDKVWDYEQACKAAGIPCSGMIRPIKPKKVEVNKEVVNENK